MKMTHEREHAHKHATTQPTSTDHDLEVGRISRSAQLDAPTNPLISGLVQRKARDANGVGDGAEQAIAAASGSSGSSLPETVMRKFESSLGTDLSSVRVHTGPESAAAAHAVGARAYTLGQNIHFGAGQYDPSSSAGQHLLAHEVAHTVQQRGGTPTRQNKLEVSTPFDPAEHEADRAADAMVAGDRAAIAFGSGVQRAIFRDADPKAAQDDDKPWAIDARTKIEMLQAAVTRAMQALNADASAAARSLQAAKATCERFESQFNQAKGTFTAHVKKAIEEEKEFQEMVKQTLETVIAAGSLGGAELAHLYETSANLLTVVTSVQKLAGTAPKKPPAAENEREAPAVDWKSVLDQALKTLTSFIRQNSSLTDLVNTCTDSDHWLTKLIEGSASKNARHTKDGDTADRLAQGAMDAQGRLGAIGGSLAPAAQSFASKLEGDLKLRGLDNKRKIEQDIAIRWMASQPTNANGTTNTGFGGRGSAEIHAAREYLEQLGVIGKDSRIGVEPGAWDTDSEDDMMVARARVESAAMKLVGATGEWQGGKINGNVASGHVVANEETWIATGPAAQRDAGMGTSTAGLPEAAGGNVRISSYTIAPISKKAEDAPAAMKAALLHELVTLQVVPSGSMGGGAMGNRPTIKPGGE